MASGVAEAAVDRFGMGGQKGRTRGLSRDVTVVTGLRRDRGLILWIVLVEEAQVFQQSH